MRTNSSTYSPFPDRHRWQVQVENTSTRTVLVDLGISILTRTGAGLAASARRLAGSLGASRRQCFACSRYRIRLNYAPRDATLHRKGSRSRPGQDSTVLSTVDIFPAGSNAMRTHNVSAFTLVVTPVPQILAFLTETEVVGAGLTSGNAPLLPTSEGLTNLRHVVVKTAALL